MIQPPGADAPSQPNFLPKFFAVLAIVFGTGMVFFTPPFQVADEFWHFYRAYQISLGQWVSRSGDNTRGGVLPVSLLELSGRFSGLPFHQTEKTSPAKILDAGKIRLRPNVTTFVHFPSSANYSPLVYAPQAMGIMAGRAAGLGPLGIFYCGREAAVLAWAVAGFFTLRLAPALRAAILLLLCMPMSLELAASFSADCVTNSVCMLFTAALWRLSALKPDPSDQISLPGKLALLALSVAVTLSKFAYLPLIALVLLIPIARFGGRRHCERFVAAIFAINILASLGWLSQTTGLTVPLRPEQADISAARQLDFVRHHPLAVPAVIARGFEHDGILIVRSFIAMLGWLDVPGSWWFIAIYWLALIAACQPAAGDPPAPSAWKMGVVAASALTSVIIFAFLNYLIWTEVGTDHVKGIQGRYFIPLSVAGAMLVWSVLRRSHRLMRAPRNARRFELFAAAFCLFSGFYTFYLIFGRYYAAG